MRKPTRKQKRTVRIMAENKGISVRQAMLKAGYSPSMANNPDKITSSPSYLALVNKYLKDEDLVKVHKAGLKAVRVTRDKWGDEHIDADYYARHAYLETAYKIKGRLNPSNGDSQGDINVTLAIYGNNQHPNTISVHAKRLPTAVSNSDGRRVQPSGDSMASEVGQGQDGTSGSD